MINLNNLISNKVQRKRFSESDSAKSTKMTLLQELRDALSSEHDELYNKIKREIEAGERMFNVCGDYKFECEICCVPEYACTAAYEWPDYICPECSLDNKPNN